MKKLFFLILVAVLVFSQKNLIIEKYNELFYQSACDTPIRYRIGFVDERFNISEKEFLSDIQQAGEIWGSVVKKKLFVYDPKGALIMNLVYDERQALNNQINQYQNTLNNQKNQINPEIAQYEKDVENFDQRKNSLNEEIQNWNNKGGASPDVYNQIINEQQALQAEAERLNSTADRLKQSTEIFNANVNKLNVTVNDLNQTLVQKPEEGLYDGEKNEIYIYFLTDQNELIHTLAHEMGHALSMNHTPYPNSIMYSFVSKTIKPSNEDVEALQQHCAKLNLIEIFIQRFQIAIQNLIKSKKINLGF
jgi:chromosome segregation ATPase